MIDEWKKGAKYWDHAWNPMIGCRKVSEGCANCYAATMAERFPELRDHDGGFLPHRNIGLKKPPKKGVVFIGNMTDLFGEWNSSSEIAGWINSLSHDATGLLLTKRPQNDVICRLIPKHLWFGITAENQIILEERFPFISAKMGNLWLSAEPMLGKIDLTVRLYRGTPIRFFKWVVVGAESGPNRRPCKLEWVRGIVQQCQDNGVKVFVKQLDIDGKLVKDIEKFPEDLQIRQVPWKM